MNLRNLFFGIHHSKRIQLSRAIMSSFVASFLDFSLVILLMEFGHTSIMIAGTSGMVGGLVFTYAIGRVWIFPPVQPGYVALEVILFTFIALIGAGIHTFILFQGNTGLFQDLHYLILKFVALTAMFTWNFSLRRIVNNRILTIHQEKSH